MVGGVEVLEHGGTARGRRPRLPGWVGRAAVAGLLVGTALAVLPSLRGGSEGLADKSEQPSGWSADGYAPTGPRVPDRRPGDPRLDTSALVLLRTPGAMVVNVDTGERIPLPDTVDWSGSGQTLLLGSTVVTVTGTGSFAAANRLVLALHPDGKVVALGYGSRILRATADSVWLVRRGDTGRTVTRVGLDGAVRFESRPLPGSVDVSGTTARGRLVVGSRWPSEPGPLGVWDPVAGRVVRTLSRAAIVHTSDDRHVVWSACSPRCPLVVTSLVDGSTRSLGPLPDGPGIAGRLRLSPDGRHFAVLMLRGGAPGVDLVIGHLPGTPRAGMVSTPLRGLATVPGQRPRLSYAQSGWLFVSTGDRVYAVAPGPHNAMELKSLPRHERMVAS